MPLHRTLTVRLAAIKRKTRSEKRRIQLSLDVSKRESEQQPGDVQVFQEVLPHRFLNIGAERAARNQLINKRLK